MRGWQAETQRLSVAACQPSYLHCGAHSTQTLQARVGLHIRVGLHLTGRAFYVWKWYRMSKSLWQMITKQQKKNIQNNAWWLVLGYSNRDYKTSDTQNSEHDVPPPLLTLTSQRNQTGLVPDCGIFMNSERKMKGSPPSFHSRSVRVSLPVCPPAFQAFCCQLGILSGHYTGLGTEPFLPARWLPWSGSARVLHGHLERGEHLDAA